MKKLLLILAITAPSITTAVATAPDATLKTYLDAMKQMASACSMNYRSTCAYPGSKAIAINGRLAMNGESYYDSSNQRLVFKNKNWLVVADHNEKIINTLYLPEWKKRMGQDYELDISGFLMNNNDASNFSSYKLKPVGDSTVLTLQYSVDKTQIVEMTLYYAKGSKIPARYTGRIKYPLGDDDNEGPTLNPAKYVTVSFDCFNILPGVNGGLFDEGRFIVMANGKAHLKKFNNYRMYKSSK